MALVALPYPNKIARDSTHELNFKAVSVKFGDTYEAIVPIGLNNIFKTFQITWLDLSKSEKDSLKTMLISGGSWQIFSYTPCNEYTLYKLRVDKDSVSIKPIGNSFFEISATLKQVFNEV
jgi:phage-related protein